MFLTGFFRHLFAHLFGHNGAQQTVIHYAVFQSQWTLVGTF